MKAWLSRVKKDNRGIGIVEIILILVILIVIIVLFRDEISKIVSKALGTIASSGNNIADTTVTLPTTK